MKRPLLAKTLLLGVLFILFLVPLGLVKDLAWERKARGDSVIEDIAASSYRAQTLAGPILVLPYRRTVRWEETVGDDEHRHVEPRVRVEAGRVIVPPKSLELKSVFDVETRARQLYEARLLHADIVATGEFSVPSRASLEAGGVAGERVDYEWLMPWVAVGVGDARGIRSLAGSVGPTRLAFAPGTRLARLPAGVMAYLDLRPGAEGGSAAFRLDIGLSGTSSLSFVPLGERTRVTLSGEWPHPSFFGSQLPVSHTETDRAFNAVWQTTHIASGVTADALTACEAADDCALLGERAFGVRLVDPVDRYLMTDRTLKYASLFLLLTFSACFLVEVIKRVRVHPVQYTLVGAAQALFFLLVLALAEHVAFGVAYLCAAVSIVLLLGYYAAAVLGSLRRGAVFAGIVAALYVLLFVILQSEDTALLMGALGLLLALATIMALTRRIDWYRFGETATPGATGITVE